MSYSRHQHLGTGEPASERTGRSWPERVETVLRHPGVTAVAGLAILGIALVVLHHLAAGVHWVEIKAEIAALRPAQLAAAAGLTALSFVGLALYDVLALESVAPGRVPRTTAALAGACGYAISNLLGFAWLTGSGLRFRIYSSLGLDWTLVAAVLATSWASLWLGIFLLLGLTLAFRPEGIATALGMPPLVDSLLGLLMLGAIAGALWWLRSGWRSGRRTISAAGVRLSLPTAPLAAGQAAAGVLDCLGAGLALYVLLPGDLTQNFALFFVVYVTAVWLGIISHAPGGLGVLEATIIAGLGAGGRSDVLAALLLYRLIYYLFPFLIAVTGLVASVAVARRHAAGRLVSAARSIAAPLAPPIAAASALASGTILMVSGSLPAESDRLELIRDLLPLPLVEATHLAGSIAGILLVVVAHGLYHRQRRAWLVACALVATGLVASLVKGLDWEEALAMVLALAFLMAFRPAFYRAGGGSLLRPDRRWMLACVALVAAVIWIGLFAYRHVPYSNDLWWHFAWAGDAPRFLRASLAAAVLLAAIGLHTLLTARPRILPPEPISDRVRDLVAGSPLTEANIALTGDKRFLLAEDGRAFLAYADTGRTLIAKGDPVGAHDAGESLVWRFRELADRLGRRCAFYAVTQDYLPTYLDSGLTLLKIGVVARVDLRRFTLDGPARRDFRHARNRAEREGYEFGVIAAAELDSVLPALRGVSDAWLASKQGTEKSFALGAFSEAYLRQFDCAVLRHRDSGRIVAFANLFQGAGRQELSVDLMRYAPDGPNFAIDALFALLLLWGREQGFRWFSLGAAPFAGMQAHPLASFWNRLGGYLYRHGDHFYHFEGLRAFKEKFGPEWSPVYLACPGGIDAPFVLLEVNRLISGGVRGLLA